MALAASNTTTLAALGFKTGTAGNDRNTATTTIEYPPGMESAAKAVAAARARRDGDGDDRR